MKEKIYITGLHLKHGGVEMAITLLANALVKRGYPVTILCLYDFGQPAYTLNHEVEIRYLTNVKPNKEEFYEAIKEKNIWKILKQGVYACKVLYLKRRKMINAVKDIDSGTIISTRNEHSVILSKYGKKGVKKIAQLHHDHAFQKKLIKDFQKHYHHIDVFVVLTQLLKDEIEMMMKNNTHTKCVVIPNFLSDIPKFPETQRENQVIAVGRLHPVKGFLKLLEIWKNVDKRNGEILKIIGDGEQKEELERNIRELGLADSVQLCGALDHQTVLAEMRKSKVYVMTSETEAFPFVLIEAMSMGLPVVSYDVRVGPQAIITHGEDGYLIQNDCKDAFIEALEELLQDEGKRESMSKRAECKANEFTEAIVMQKWLEILSRQR